MTRGGSSMASELLAGRYRLGPKIAEGAVGAVYRAHDMTLGRDVAIKVLRAELARDDAVRERFRRETQAAAQISHPNIVKILDTGEAGGRPYVVMEYLPEPDLKEIIVRYAPLPEDKVAEMGMDCCRALEYIHRLGLVHRDVKPQNILFTADGTAKLSDFGIAAAVGEQTLSARGTVTGTPAYMAPEQVQGLPAVPQSDIYALGCILYEALTGRQPFEGRTAEEVMRAHLADRPRPVRSVNPSVSPSMEFIVHKAMAKDPSRRYRTATEMMSDLAKVAAGEELDRTGVLPLEPPRAPVVETAEVGEGEAGAPERRRVRTVVSIVVGAVGAVILLAALVWLIKHATYPGQAPHLVQVPSVKFLPLHEAKKKLAEHGLTAGKVTFQESDLYDKGVVIDQRPAMGSTVQAGTSVSLVVNKGKATVEMIDVTGMRIEQAISRLQDLGLTVGEVEKRYDDAVPQSRVIKQSIEQGTSVEKGSPVDLVVSKGPQPPPEEVAEAAEEEGPGPPAGEASEEEPEAAYPQVDVRDLTPDRGPEETHTYEIRITVLGRKPQQEIMVIARDASGKRIDVVRERLDPQSSKQVQVELQGRSTIEVYHEGRPVLKQEVPGESMSPLPGTGEGAGSDTTLR